MFVQVSILHDDKIIHQSDEYADDSSLPLFVQNLSHKFTIDFMKYKIGEIMHCHPDGVVILLRNKDMPAMRSYLINQLIK